MRSERPAVSPATPPDPGVSALRDAKCAARLDMRRGAGIERTACGTFARPGAGCEAVTPFAFIAEAEAIGEDGG